jgi:hypothetical protein
MRKEFYIKTTSGSEGNYEEYIYRKSHWQAITVQTDMHGWPAAPHFRVLMSLKRWVRAAFFIFNIPGLDLCFGPQFSDSYPNPLNWRTHPAPSRPSLSAYFGGNAPNLDFKIVLLKKT